MIDDDHFSRIRDEIMAIVAANQSTIDDYDRMIERDKARRNVERAVYNSLKHDEPKADMVMRVYDIEPEEMVMLKMFLG